MERYSYSRETETPRSNPSFSSTLLDAIYRSIDESEEKLTLQTQTMRKKTNNVGLQSEEESANLQRACMIEKWMERKVNDKAMVQTKSMVEAKPRAYSMFLKSSSSSSDSSSGGGFSSSEADESVHGVSSSSSCYGFQRPKPIRTWTNSVATASKFNHQVKNRQIFDHNIHRHDHHAKRVDYQHQQKPKPKDEAAFVKTKSKAMKIYGDLKKVKQPISPGGRLATFLNSLFNAKKDAKIPSNKHATYEDSSPTTLKSSNTSTCSSASSFSRSCLISKNTTPNSSGVKCEKRSVRFFPVSVILDEDSQPCGHKSLLQEKHTKDYKTSINKELKEKNRRVEEAARDLLKNYQKKVESELDRRKSHIKNHVFEHEDEFLDDDEDDFSSDASSDLFELDNLSAIGMEELPVYETTHLKTNRAVEMVSFCNPIEKIRKK